MDNGTLINTTPIYDAEYTNLVNSYKDMLHSLINEHFYLFNICHPTDPPSHGEAPG